MTTRFVILLVAIGVAVARSVSADDNVREVQDKLRDGGFYSGESDGAYSSQLSEALTRYQSRNGLPITGQLDEDTSKALGAKPAVGPSATEQSSSETWRQLRKGERRTSTSAQRSETAATEVGETSSPRSDEAVETSTETRPRSAPAATAAMSSEVRGRVSAPPATASTSDMSTERLRDYVAAFVLAGIDKNVGAEVEFFADRVDYYDGGVMNREDIREDLKRYDEKWPERRFWIAGAMTVEPQSQNRVRVTFPLGFKLRNDNTTVTGKTNKTLVLESAGDDLQIVAVNERKEK